MSAQIRYHDHAALPHPSRYLKRATGDQFALIDLLALPACRD